MAFAHQRKPQKLQNNSKGICYKLPHSDGKGKPIRRTVCNNAMTQTSEPPAQPQPMVKPMATVEMTSSPVNGLHWSLATSAHKLPGGPRPCCLNASEKVMAACQAVEVSATSLHSLVECLRMLPQTPGGDSTLAAEKGCTAISNSRLGHHRPIHAASARSRGVRPIRTSSPVECCKREQEYPPNVSNELALLLDKVRELRMAAADADRELTSLRKENALLRRQIAGRTSADSSLKTAANPLRKTSSAIVSQPALASPPPPSSTKEMSPFAKYPNLRTLLMPATSSLLDSVSAVGKEDFAPTPSLSNNEELPVKLTCLDKSTSSVSSPFYSAMQSADDGLDRLRRHLAAVQPISTQSSVLD